jgi:hypothetical protein
MDTFYVTFTWQGKVYEGSGTLRETGEPALSGAVGDANFREITANSPCGDIPRKKPREGLLPLSALEEVGAKYPGKPPLPHTQTVVPRGIEPSVL